MTYAKHGKAEPTIDRQQMYDNIIGQGESGVSLVVGRLITLLGFKSKLIGTRYLQDAILYRYDNHNVMRVGMTNRAYIAVADLWGSTANRVERAIRNSIINCYTHGALKIFNELAQAPIISADFAPSNGEFMSSVVNWLQLEKQSGNIK